MYTFFYPETGKRPVLGLEFNTAKEAVDYFRNGKGLLWITIEATGPNDLHAFLEVMTGDIVVVRKVTEEGVDG